MTREIRKPKRPRDQGKIKTAGAPVTVGKSKPFNEWLKKTTGIDRETYLAEVEKAGGESLTDRIKARLMAMEEYQNFIAPIIQYYNMTKARGITLQEDLMILESDLVDYRTAKLKEDPSWTSVGDKAYQDALKHKADLMKSFAKIRIEWEKMNDGKTDGKTDAISVGDMVVEDDN